MVKKELTDKDYEKMGRVIENVYLIGSKNMWRMMWYNFVRGIAYGFGLFLAGTVVVSIVLAILGQFDEVPFIQKLIDVLLKSNSN